MVVWVDLRLAGVKASSAVHLSVGGVDVLHGDGEPVNVGDVFFAVGSAVEPSAEGSLEFVVCLGTRSRHVGTSPLHTVYDICCMVDVLGGDLLSGGEPAANGQGHARE